MARRRLSGIIWNLRARRFVRVEQVLGHARPPARGDPATARAGLVFLLARLTGRHTWEAIKKAHTILRTKVLGVRPPDGKQA